MTEENTPWSCAGEKELKERPSRARYDRVRMTLDRKWRRRHPDRDRMMREVVDVLWDSFAGAPYSWCGFYLPAKDGKSLVLGPHRDKPACSPIPMHGMCGSLLSSRMPVIVPDVKALGKKHLACDPKARSEIAVPVFDAEGQVAAVFDVDSLELGAFDEMDQRWLERILKPFREISGAWKK